MNNIFSGFDAELLAEAFGVSSETAIQLQQESTRQGSLLKVVQELVIQTPFEL